MNDKNSLYEIAQIEINRHLEDANYNRLAHFAIAKRYKKRHMIFVVYQAVSTAIILTLLLSPIDITFLKIFFGLIIAITSALGSHLNFYDLSIMNHLVAQKYQTLWRQCLNWKTDFPDESYAEEALQKAKFFRDRINEINRDSPQISDWAHKRVKEYLEQGMDTFDFENVERELEKNSTEDIKKSVFNLIKSGNSKIKPEKQ